MKTSLKTKVFALATTVGLMCTPALARDQLYIVSTPSDFAYTALVGEQFANINQLPMPFVERRSPRSAVHDFCAGVGANTPDAVGLGRPMMALEKSRCQENGVGHITEIKVGYDGLAIVSGSDSDAFPVTRRQLFLAMAAVVPVNGRLLPNPHQTWRSIDPTLPDRPIKIVGLLLDSDMGQALIELVMEPGCRSFAEIAALGPKHAAQVCSTLRADRALQQVSRHYRDAIKQVTSDDSVVALLPYALFEENQDRLAAHPVEGVVPNEVSLATHRYPVTCPLYLYVKLAHNERVPGILEFVAEYTSRRASGPDGYLVDTGLVPLSHRDRITQRAEAIELLSEPMQSDFARWSTSNF